MTAGVPDDRDDPAPRRLRADGQAVSDGVVAELLYHDEEADVLHSRVHFRHGARSRWHVHLGSQVLYFLEGRGLVQDDGGEVMECVPGDVVLVPSRTRHVHGAMPGANATHVAVTRGGVLYDDEGPSGG